MESTAAGILIANACFLAWVVLAVVAVGRASGRHPFVGGLILWAIAAWGVFAACVVADELALGRLLNWPNIVLMLLLALHWALRDRRKRLPMARALLIGGLGLEAAAIAFRTVMVAIGDTRSVLLMQYESVANLIFLGAALLGLVLATVGMLLAALDDVNRRLRFALEVDCLTRLSSRHFFFETARHLATGKPSSLLMIDVDHFKSINDRHGHEAGDAVLRRMGELFRSVLPRDCVAARFGGEEFVVLLEVADADAARQHAEALRQAIAALPFSLPQSGPEIAVTVSIGVAHGVVGIDDLLRDADAALYRAKAEGRNRCMRASG